MVHTDLENPPRLLLPDWFDARVNDEMLSRGYLSGARVVDGFGRVYPVYFIDPVRLAQDLESEVGLGRCYLAESGMIILPEITLAAIERAVQALWKEGFFQRLSPILR